MSILYAFLFSLIRATCLAQLILLDLFILIVLGEGRAVAQAVIRWLPTAAARVRVWVACGGL
jgi:hypothetical protein